MVGNKKMVLVCCLILASLAVTSTATMEDDEKDCADQLANLASCIPYVSGTANKPTPECCQDTQKVKANKPKCLCVLIKESTDPSMGLPVNTTLALQMPSACNIDAKVSDCPKILNISPDSADAKIFQVAGQDWTPASVTDSPQTPASPSSGSPSTTSSSPQTSSKSDSKAATSSSAGAVVKSSGSEKVTVMMALFALMFI